MALEELVACNTSSEKYVIRAVETDYDITTFCDHNPGMASFWGIFKFEEDRNRQDAQSWLAAFKEKSDAKNYLARLEEHF